MSHTTPRLPLIFNPPLSPFLPTSRRLQRGSALAVTHPGWGRSSPRGRAGTGGCWAPRAGAGRTPRAACWPRRRAAAGAGAPRPPTAPPRTRGSQCPGRCCGTGEAFAVLFLQPGLSPGVWLSVGNRQAGQGAGSGTSAQNGTSLPPSAGGKV